MIHPPNNEMQTSTSIVTYPTRTLKPFLGNCPMKIVLLSDKEISIAGLVVAYNIALV